METTAAVTIELHARAMAASPRELVGLLREVLTPELTAYISGVDDVSKVIRWSTGEVTEIGDDAVKGRLRTAYEMVSLLMAFDAPRTIRAWFTGMNDLLGDLSPAEVVRDGRFDDALGAATAFVAYG